MTEPRPWFDTETGVLTIGDYIAEMPSFQRIMADAIVSDGELAEQSARVVRLFEALENELTPRTKELVTEMLCELAVLDALHLQRLEGDARGPFQVHSHHPGHR